MEASFCKWVGIGALVLFMSGCAVGQKYNLMLADPKIQVSGNGTIAVAVQDQRPIIIEGKEPTIAGLIRGGWGLPFHTYTTSGNPLAIDMAETVKKSLEKTGFSVLTVVAVPAADNKPALEVLKQQQQKKSLLLTFSVWLPDLGSGGNLSLDHDLKLYVLGAQGQVLVETVSSGHEDIGKIGGFSGITERYEEYTVAAFKAKIEALFNRPGILEALR
jgi:hypothetical protein